MNEDESQNCLLIPASELARLLNVSMRQIYRLHSAGKIPSPVRIGGSVRWRKNEIIEFIQAGAPDRTIWDKLKGTSNNSKI